jgi:hypothetical protein
MIREKAQQIIQVLAVIRVAIVIAGLILNFLTILALRAKVTRRNVVLAYIFYIAIADSHIVIILARDLSWLMSNQSQDLLVTWSIACKLWHYVGMSLSPISSWLFAALSIENMFASINLKKRECFFQAKNFPPIYLWTVVILHFLAYLYVPFELEHAQVKAYNNNQTITECNIKYMKHARVFLNIYFVDLIWAPLVFILLIRAFLIVKIRMLANNLNERVRRRRRRAKAHKFAIKTLASIFVMTMVRLSLIVGLFISLNDHYLNEIVFSFTLLIFSTFSIFRTVFNSINFKIFKKKLFLFLHLQ